MFFVKPSALFFGSDDFNRVFQRRFLVLELFRQRIIGLAAFQVGTVAPVVKCDFEFAFRVGADYFRRRFFRQGLSTALPPVPK